ncbi:hypothetical protein ACFYY1_09835 [Streptomyces sp. NPDC001890]
MATRVRTRGNGIRAAVATAILGGIAAALLTAGSAATLMARRARRRG